MRQLLLLGLVAAVVLGVAAEAMARLAHDDGRLNSPGSPRILIPAD